MRFHAIDATQLDWSIAHRSLLWRSIYQIRYEEPSRTRKPPEDLEKDVLTGDTWVAPEAKKRCDWISNHYAEKDSNLSKDDLHTKYKAQGKDANSFYRATADLFWHDFVNGGWGEFDLLRLADPLKDGSPLQRTSTWTWVTGDQHLSNFGAFHARDGDVVYGMNDFDEAV